jgi:bacteriocin-like protein
MKNLNTSELKSINGGSEFSEAVFRTAGYIMGFFTSESFIMAQGKYGDYGPKY